jgi:hypothetical protein
VLTAAVALLAADRGIGWLNLVSALCALGSLYLSLFAKLVDCGRRTLGLTPKHPGQPDASALAKRLAIKATLGHHAVALLYPASIALILSAVIG